MNFSGLYKDSEEAMIALIRGPQSFMEMLFDGMRLKHRP